MLAAALFGLVALLPATAAFSQQSAAAAETIAAAGSPAYEVPADKADKWDSLQNMIQKQYATCLEDCANDKACEDRCTRAFDARRDRAYRQLMAE